MLDTYAMLGGEENLSFIKDFYDIGNINADGSIPKYISYEVDSVPMGLPLFDILDDTYVGKDYDLGCIL